VASLQAGASSGSKLLHNVTLCSRKVASCLASALLPAELGAQLAAVEAAARAHTDELQRRNEEQASCRGCTHAFFFQVVGGWLGVPQWC